MLKIRLQGTTGDIKWFLKILSRDRRFQMNTPSDILQIKGSKKYKRAYAQLFRDGEPVTEYQPPDKTRECGKQKQEQN